MKKLIILGAFLFSINSLNAQTSTNYEEASNPISTNPSLWVKVSAPQVSWGSTDIRYKKEEPAPIARLKKDINLTAWKGERVSAQLVVWTPEALDNLSFIVSDLTSGKETISKDNVRTGFVRYVMTDELNKDGKGGWGIPYETKSGKKRCYFAKYSDCKDSKDGTDNISNAAVIYGYSRNTLEERLKAKVCELCGDTNAEYYEIHHVHKVKDLKGKNDWERAMIAKRRKTLVLCRNCHHKVHNQ